MNNPSQKWDTWDTIDQKEERIGSCVLAALGTIYAGIAAAALYAALYNADKLVTVSPV